MLVLIASLSTAVLHATNVSAANRSLLKVKNPNLVLDSRFKLNRKKVQCNFEQASPLPGFRVTSKKKIMFLPLQGAELTQATLRKACPAKCTINKKAIAVTMNTADDQITIPVRAKDSCGLSITSTQKKAPTSGSLVTGSTLVYVANDNFSGRDNFTVQLSNGRKKDSQVVAVAVARSGSCQLVIPGSNFVTTENESYTLPIPANDSCNKPVQIGRLTDPTHGQLVLDGSSAQYVPDLHYVGSDSFTLTISFGRAQNISYPISMTINSGPEQFAGVATSLAPYRARLTPQEVRHLLKKVALGGNQELYDIGVTEGREALVNALIDYQNPDSVDQTAAQRAESVRDIDGCSRPVWFTSATQNYWLYQMRYGNPLKEHAALHLHDHFAINLDSVKYLWGCATSWGFRDHFEKIRGFALSSFAGFTQSLFTDTAMSYWLDNRLNRYGADSTDTGPYYDVQRTGNQNFGRELMELFTIGKFDPYTKLRNYNEQDIELATRAVSGFHSRWTTYVNPDTSLPADQTGLLGYNNWFSTYAPYTNYGVDTRYDQTLAYQGQLSIFQGIPGAAVTRRFTPYSFTDYLLYEHPAGARNIAYSFFNRYAYVHPTEAMTDELATLLRSTHYDMKQFLRRVLNSSAMFSTKAKTDCIASPAEFMINFVKQANYPVDSLAALSTMRQGLVDMNHNLLNAPNVFAWGMCGDNSLGVENHGETWLQNQMLLNRYRTVNNIIKQQDGEGVRLKDILFPSWNNPNADAVLARFEEAFNLPLSSAEKELVRSYLDRSEAPWNPANDTMVRQRLAGLAFIFATHIKNMLQ